ncbi:UDP-N-acetylglucosamine 2-epimerase (non-hydrolyzing) [Phytoactinopolyspora alkaliphila]|uniref:UDP-N-acetylglucosamine 2-epimerase (non-hydrolyzing) n=1 Tax=Phytoactinopolyspora alkaliphila TaxID=1783498 RepID=A0A6N9YM01_9ACTN|nr:UDP-N-acetylglucosamine 2-epimerase (non-hydrolyzing) [Phytoactinopolyspora alkaliphila]
MFQGKRTVLVAYGSRPEAIKLAPVVAEIHRSAWLHPVVAVSGQSRDALRPVHQLFGIVPDADLDLELGGSPARVGSQALEAYSTFLASADFDAVVVQGDTPTAFAAALAGFYARVPVVHVEAGLRTGYFYSPFPEEVHRRLIAQVASLHLAPTAMSRENLLEEGIYPGDVCVTGNTVIDSLLQATGMRKPTGDPEVDEAITSGRPILLVTAERRGWRTTDVAAIGRAVSAIARLRPDLLVVVVAEEETVAGEMLEAHRGAHGSIRVLEPLPYGPFSRLLSRSVAVLTDSGGIQEEAPTFGVPVFVTREATERPEALEAGTARLVGTQLGAIVNAVLRVLDSSGSRVAAETGNPFGDGRASRRVRAAIEELLGVGRRLPEFGAPARRVDSAKAS